jgi:hypothetical protein
MNEIKINKNKDFNRVLYYIMMINNIYKIYKIYIIARYIQK